MTNDPTISAVVATLRRVAGWRLETDEAQEVLLEVAREVELLADGDDGRCCPVCDEAECDDDCPLAVVRGRSSPNGWS